MLSQLVDCEPMDAGDKNFLNQDRRIDFPGGQSRASGNLQKELLAGTIEAQIIPRLMLAHRLTHVHPEQKNYRKNRALSVSEVTEFARLVVHHDVGIAGTYVDILRKQGISLESIFMNLLAPAAKHLGELWLLDSCTFVDVTVGLSRIQQLVHQLSQAFENEGRCEERCRTALLAQSPGEQHGLGVLLVEEFFRREGWNVWAPNRASADELVRTVADEHFDIAGISVTRGVALDDLSSVIGAIRRSSINPDIMVIVGGNYINNNPDIVERIGADATDSDGSQAPRLLEMRGAQVRRLT